MSGRRAGLPGDYLDTLMPQPAETSAVRPQEAGTGRAGGDEAAETRPSPPSQTEPAQAGQRPPRVRKTPAGGAGAQRGRVPSVAPAATPAPRVRKERVTFQLDPRLVEEARDATVFLLTRGQPASLAGLVEGALMRELERLRKEHHLGGKGFPSRAFAPPPGRRVGRPGGA